MAGESIRGQYTSEEQGKEASHMFVSELKLYLASAFGLTANRSFMTVKYVRLPELLGELAIARAEGNYRKLMKSYKTVQLLILDEWLLSPLRDTESKELLEIVEARYKKGSTIFCSQFESAVGTKKLETQHLQTQSATASSTIHIASLFPATTQCASAKV